jgi:hypothetical protein
MRESARPVRRDEVRPAAVSGFFYPEVRGELAGLVRSLLGAAFSSVDEQRSPPKAVVCPHAGYAYSGPIAATALSRLRGEPGHVVFVIGPPHRVALRGCALPSATHFSTPLGDVEVDRESVEALAAHRDVEVNATAHEQEHSLEVELPFLQALFGETLRVVPILVGTASAERLAELLEEHWDRPGTSFVFSSDLSHYEDYVSARRHDERTVERLLSGRYADLESRDACGHTALNGLIELAAAKRATAELLRLENSGDHNGPRDRVVGYGAVAYYPREATARAGGEPVR